MEGSGASMAEDFVVTRKQATTRQSSLQALLDVRDPCPFVFTPSCSPYRVPPKNAY